MRVNEEAELAVKLYAVRCRRGIVGLTTSDDRCDQNHATFDAAKLKSIARSLRRMYEQDCNYGDNPAEKREMRIQAAAEKIIETYGLKYNTNGDPRGYGLYLHFPDGSYNTMGGKETGWGI